MNWRYKVPANKANDLPNTRPSRHYYLFITFESVCQKNAEDRPAVEALETQHIPQRL